MIITKTNFRSALMTLAKTREAGSMISTSEITNAIVTVLLAIVEKHFSLPTLGELDEIQNQNNNP